MSDSQKPRGLTSQENDLCMRLCIYESLSEARETMYFCLGFRYGIEQADIFMQQAQKMREALQAVLKRHAWTPGMGDCICQPHLDGYKALEQFDEFMKVSRSGTNEVKE